MRRTFTPRRAALASVAVALFAAALPNDCAAQYLTRPAHDWRTVHTARFDVHFPAEMTAWALPVAQRLDSIAAAVDALVGNSPQHRVTVMIEDPLNVANGFALPFLDAPVVFLWPTPPTPSPTFGDQRDPSEVLAVHEYGHIAHLTFPSRNPFERRLWAILPANLGPLSRQSPSWVIEGYATYIEGRITGDGRPASVGRAAVIREWALEGKLPTYGQLDNGGPFFGGSMRYLVGSAFLEWLAARKGEASLTSLWRRMSARQRRTFGAAFVGVYGAGPADLYGRFFAEVTAEAVAVERQMRAAPGGLQEGTLVQHLAWYTGEPAVSRDGKLLAITLRSPLAPSRIAVIRTGNDPVDTTVARRLRERFKRDPLDVPAFDSFPRAKRIVASLPPDRFRSHDAPRWFGDGIRLLVTRDEALGDGATRPDLFVWNYKTGDVRRVTHGAGIRGGDPAPDGRSAAAVRCANGVCDLVQVDIASGTIRVLVPGSPTVVWHRPRWSPDGSRIAATVHRDGRWRTAVVTLGSRPEVTLVPTPDSAERFAPSWAPDGRSLVVVSERGGVDNLERLPLDGAPVTTLTRTTGAALSPDVSLADGMVYYLTMYASGFDLRRTPSRPDSAPELVSLPAGPNVVYPRGPARADTFARRPVDGPHRYGVGPRMWRVLPGAGVGPDGAFGSLMIANVDPVSRLGVVLQGGAGERSAWRGGSLGATVRSWTVAQVEGTAFVTEQRPSEQRGLAASVEGLDARYAGASLALARTLEGGVQRMQLRLGGSAGSLRPVGNASAEARTLQRSLGFGEITGAAIYGQRERYVSARFSLDGSGGRTGDASWTRGIGSLRISAAVQPFALIGEGRWGTVSPNDAAPFEQFAVGGATPPFFDAGLLSQRITVPALPIGAAGGRKVAMYRVFAPLRLPLRPYMTWVSAGDSLARYLRVAGAEAEFDSPPLGFARLPSVHVLGGAGYSFDTPFAYKTRIYLTVQYRP